jgi:hypothetical protein
MASGAQAQDVGQDETASARIIQFKLPSEPLVNALHDYSQVTNHSVMAQTQLLEGLTSSAVEGGYSAADALKRLLIGTGLRAEFTAAGEAAVIPLQPGEQAWAPSAAASSAFIPAATIDGAANDGDYFRYNAIVQTRLIEALCGTASTRPGDYRMVVQLRIGDDGSVLASKAVGTTGNPSRDEAIKRVVNALEIEPAPPAGLRQPITVLLRPQGAGVHMDCERYDAGD